MLIVKRIVMFLWSLAGLCAVALLSLSLVGPWTEYLDEVFTESYFALVVLYVLVGLLVLGLLYFFVRSFALRKPRHVVVTQMSDGAIVVTRDALASQAAHVVAQYAGLHARDVFVNIRRKAKVDVRVRIEPSTSVNVMGVGPQVHDGLVDELKLLCGEHLDKVCVEFMRAKEPALSQLATGELAVDDAAAAANTTSEITIPVSETSQLSPATTEEEQNNEQV